MSNKSIKKRLISLITAFVVVFVALLVVSQWVYVPYTEEEIKENNKDISITYCTEDGDSTLSFQTDSRYDMLRDGYFTEVYFTGMIYNSLEESINDVTMTFGFSIDKSHTVEHIFDELKPGENNFVRYKIGSIYREYSYTRIGEISYSAFYNSPQGEMVYCNRFIDPEVEHYHFSVTANIFVCVFILIDALLVLLIIITIISCIRNKMLVEEVSATFVVGEEGSSPKPTKVEKEEKKEKGEPLVYCKYCGGEFYEVLSKCPDCGARLTKKYKKKS